MVSPELIQACLRNDEIARKQLVEVYYGQLMGLCYRYAKNNEQAEIFLKQGFIEVFTHLSEYHQNSDFENWIKICFLNSIIKQLQSNRAEYFITTTTRNVEDKKNSTDLFHQAEDNNPNSLSAEQYIKALQKLPCSFRAVYNLHVIEGYDLQTVTNMLEISEYSAQNTLERARHEFSKNVQLQLQGY